MNIDEKYQAAATRERAIIDQINANSATMTPEEIRALDEERRKCVASRRLLRAGQSALAGLRPTALEAIKAALAE